MKILLLAVILGLTGCATQRFLSAEEDQQMRESCEAQGCTVLPNGVLEQLLNMLEGKRV